LISPRGREAARLLALEAVRCAVLPASYGLRVTLLKRRSGPSGTSRSNAERRARGGPIIKSFTLEQELAVRLEAEARRHDIHQAQIVADALRRYLPTLERRAPVVSKS
jgi:hypothetical protein